MQGNSLATAAPASDEASVGLDNLQVGSAGEDDLRLIWPEKLIRELAEQRRFHPWATPAAIANFIVMSLLALILGPTQLIIMVITGDVVSVTDDYFPNALRICLLCSGLVAIMAVIIAVRTWKEQPEHTFSVLALSLGTTILAGVTWLRGYVATGLGADQLTLLYLLIIVATIAFTVVLLKKPYIPDQKNLAVSVGLVTVVALGALETVFTGLYLLGQTHTITDSQIALDELGAAQAAARVDGISPELSDLVYTICGGKYDVVYLQPTSTDNGLFECRDSHEVYSVAGPMEVTTTTMQGSAFYFGVTKNDFIAKYFTPEMNVKYLYRDLSSLESTPSELVMLVPAASEEILVNRYLEPLLGLVNERDQSTPLQVTMFYTPEVNNVITTKDFILIGAADTLAMLNILPRGQYYTAYLNGQSGKFIFSPDTAQSALNELAASPLLYSSQTLDALMNQRHIMLNIDAHRTYTADELRNLLYANFVDPIVAE